MFTYVKMKNFMSLKEAEFDFRGTGKSPKKMIAIYGENGSGKSNFVTCFDFLRSSVASFRTIDTLGKIQELVHRKELPKNFAEDLLRDLDILNFAANCRLIGCKEQTQIEYGFQENGHQGYYKIAFDDSFQSEELYYYTGKQSGRIFKIQNLDGQIDVTFSPKLTKNKKVEGELKDEVYKYWGKHTFLSILHKEMIEKNAGYIAENYLSYVFDILIMLQETNIHCKKTNHSGKESRALSPDNILKDFYSGTIDLSNIEILDRSERILNDFFTQTYADIKEVFFEKSTQDDQIEYTLYLKKMIGGELRTLNFRNESAGTQQILEIIRSLLGAFCGVTVIYDEIDNGIHDLLLKTILESMQDQISGQLIFTTHNTYLLETLDIKSVYVINVDYKGNKTITCLDEFPRIQGSNNPRVMYLKGMFGGIPIIDTVDYDAIINDIQTEEGDEELGEVHI